MDLSGDGAELHTGSATAINQSFTELQSSLAAEKAPGTLNWKRIAVSDDGTAIVALTAQEGAPSLWLWTDHKAGLLQHIKDTIKVSFRIYCVCKDALFWLLQAALAAAELAMHACMVGCLPARGSTEEHLT